MEAGLEWTYDDEVARFPTLVRELALHFVEALGKVSRQVGDAGISENFSQYNLNTSSFILHFFFSKLLKNACMHTCHTTIKKTNGHREGAGSLLYHLYETNVSTDSSPHTSHFTPLTPTYRIALTILIVSSPHPRPMILSPRFDEWGDWVCT